MESPNDALEVFTKAQLQKKKVPELKELLKQRSLPISGNKPELISRLLGGAEEEKKGSKRKKTESKAKVPSDADSNSEEEEEGDDPSDDSDCPKRPKKAAKISEYSKEDGDAISGGGIVASLVDDKWKQVLASEFQKPYFKAILQFLEKEKSAGATYYPPDHEVMNAFNYTPFDQVKVVIIGQDPYFKVNQAHGICFSVKKGVAVPPSLRTIYKELETDIKGFKAPKHGYLEEWARQGVLMLNATLTVRDGKANSHAKCGWQTFTDRVLDILNEKKEGLVFLLWGQFAQTKAKNVNTKKHHILNAPHPSPLAGGKFNGCEHFSKTNELLEEMGKTPIDWTLSP